ncbi:class I SAM-dependent methyltransferase [Actinotalea soli]|uniref:class I SAM-dependent methyltransferase n=1 Tax=Actinotalea soli TaxID=2819234 RepID=UPI0027DDAAAE|nr:class I SAM-dependent methyltransferase [Actinotalea soli]
MTIDTPSRDRAASFDLGVAAYGQARPGYPDDAARWLVPGAGCRVVDLAAGTGKLTSRLIALGHTVTAVEPSHGMRAELERTVPGVWTLAGTAEAIPVPDSSVDAVVVAQAWHWFSPRHTVPEVARVLRPGGHLSVVWNVRDHRVDWVDQFTRIIHEGDTLAPSHREPVLDEQFAPIEHARFPWTHRLRPADLRTLAASRSHTLTLPTAEREALLTAVDELARTHPDLAGRDHVDLPYRATCWRARLR